MKSSVCKQKDSFLGAVKTEQDLLLTSYRLSHHIFKTKKPFTLGEKVIKPALQIVAEQLLDNATEVSKHTSFRYHCKQKGISYGRRFVGTTSV